MRLCTGDFVGIVLRHMTFKYMTCWALHPLRIASQTAKEKVVLVRHKDLIALQIPQSNLKTSWIVIGVFVLQH